MILSRARPLSRATIYALSNLLQGSCKSNLKQAVRTKGYVHYRNPIPPDEYVKEIKTPYIMLSAAFWWWVIWRLVSEFHVFLGPSIPRMKDWTDEELGVPPIHEDP